MTREHFDSFLTQFCTMPKLYNYEYSLTTLVFGLENQLTISQILNNLNQIFPEKKDTTFILIIDKLKTIQTFEQFL